MSIYYLLFVLICMLNLTLYHTLKLLWKEWEPAIFVYPFLNIGNILFFAQFLLKRTLTLI